MLQYDETIEVHGISVPFVADIITPRIEKPVRNGRYEKGEVALIRRLLRSGDRLLDLGTGLGLVSTAAALTPGVEAVLSVEADPALIPLVREIWKKNGVTNGEIRNAAASASMATEVDFYVRGDFWASSTEPDSRPYEQVEKITTANVAHLLEEFRPTVLFCDIEGGELGLLDGVDLSGLRHIVMGTHPKIYGQEGLRTIVDQLADKGFLPAPGTVPGGPVKQFDRVEIDGQMLPDADMPRRHYRADRPKKPRILLPSCMKNEGPFVLEWLAWHRAIGVTDFIVFTNHCTDGTDQLLEHLDQLGYLRHLPNPALAGDGRYFQPVALRYVPHFPEFREADYVISMDVDEFINVRIGDGLLSDLLDAAGDFDVLSMSELNHGCNGRHQFEPGHLSELFPGHQTETPGRHRASRGVKSITRLSPRVEKVRNHRPDLTEGLGSVIWRDGSGRPRSELTKDPTANGWDCRGTYDLVSLDHFPLRSLESYLVKMHRGDAVVANKKVSQRYWRTRNRSDQHTSDMGRGIARMKVEFDRLLEDPKTRALHEACVAAHAAQIAALADEAEYTDRKQWIYQNAWHEDYPEEAQSYLAPPETAAEDAD